MENVCFTDKDHGILMRMHDGEKAKPFSGKVIVNSYLKILIHVFIIGSKAVFVHA